MDLSQCSASYTKPPYVPPVNNINFPSNVVRSIYLSDICSTGGGPEEEELGQQEEAEPLSGRIILHLLNNGQSSTATIQILGVDRRAPIELIKKAYRAKVVFIREAIFYGC